MSALKINLLRFRPTKNASYRELCSRLVDANYVIFHLLKELREIHIQSTNQSTDLSTKISNAMNKAMYKNV